jgi:chemotaxis protein histidine kinase CheA
VADPETTASELDAEMAFIQKKIAEGIARKQKELEERHRRELENAHKDFESRLGEKEREHRAALEKLERELREKQAAALEERSEKLSSEFAEEFAKQEQTLRAKFAEERKAFQEDLQRRSDADLARDKRDLEETFQAKLRKREEELKERFEGDLRNREAELRRALELEYRQKLTEAQTKIEEDLRSRSKELQAAAEQAAQQKIDLERARIENENARKLDTEVARVEHEHRQKLSEAEADLKEKFAGSVEKERHRIEEDFRVRLLKRGRYARLSHALQKPLYPFPAFVGLEKAKRALLLNAINPNVNGVVLWGRQGNGKFSLLLAFAEMLAPMEKDLVGRPEEFRPWNDEERYLTGRVHYGKEMATYLVDTYLQCATLSLPPAHRRTEGPGASEMPQMLLSSLKDEDEHAYHLLNGFTLHVEVSSPNTVEERLEIMHRNAEFRKAPGPFREKYRAAIEDTLGNIRGAREKVASVAISTKILALVARMTILDKQSSRLDVLMEQLARTNAAFEGRSEVDPTDVMEAADLALMHRLTPREMADLERTLPHEGTAPHSKG